MRGHDHASSLRSTLSLSLLLMLSLVLPSAPAFWPTFAWTAKVSQRRPSAWHIRPNAPFAMINALP